MKSMWPPLVAIFFITYFYRAGEEHAGSGTVNILLFEEKSKLFHNLVRDDPRYFTSGGSRISLKMHKPGVFLYWKLHKNKRI